jgi:hypothetical protein
MTVQGMSKHYGFNNSLRVGMFEGKFVYHIYHELA